jgi:hypothetical protein
MIQTKISFYSLFTLQESEIYKRQEWFILPQANIQNYTATSLDD